MSDNGVYLIDLLQSIKTGANCHIINKAIFHYKIELKNGCKDKVFLELLEKACSGKHEDISKLDMKMRGWF